MWVQGLHRRVGSGFYRFAAEISSGWLLAIAIASLMAICTIVGLMLYSARLEVTRGAVTAVSNLARTIVEDETRDIERLDLSLQDLRDGVLDPDVMGLPPKLQRTVLFDRAAMATDLDALLVLDQDGRILFDSDAETPRPQRFGDSDFFLAHLHDANRGLFIGRPFLSPFDGEWVIALSRRITRPDGSFAGVVAGMMKLSYFDDLFGRLDLGSNGAMTLFSTDGTLIMRRPLDEHDIGRMLSSAVVFRLLKTSTEGTFEARAKYDGVPRLYWFQKVGEYPLVQTVGLGIEELYASWWRRSVVTTGALMVICTTILGLVGYLQIELGRRAKAEAAYAQLAATDKLTGLPNRRRFDEVLDAEWRRAGRAGNFLSLLLVDVDHFKAYNDNYGHLGGDAILASLGACLSATLMRPGDFAARYGGEEFVLLLPNTDARGAMKVAERLRIQVADMRQPHVAGLGDILTISIGVAAMVPQPGQPEAELMTAADLALYNAKSSGRNRAVLCRPGERKFAA